MSAARRARRRAQRDRRRDRPPDRRNGDAPQAGTCEASDQSVGRTGDRDQRSIARASRASGRLGCGDCDGCRGRLRGIEAAAHAALPPEAIATLPLGYTIIALATVTDDHGIRAVQVTALGAEGADDRYIAQLVAIADELVPGTRNAWLGAVGSGPRGVVPMIVVDVVLGAMLLLAARPSDDETRRDGSADDESDALDDDVRAALEAINAPGGAA